MTTVEEPGARMDRSAFGPSSPWPISWILNQVVIVLQEYNWRQVLQDGRRS